MTIVVLCGCGFPLIFSYAADEHRIIIFKEPIPNKVLTGHVIRDEDVPNEGSCRVLCYMEPDCVSINVGPLKGGKHTCELNRATTEQQGFSYALRNMAGYTYLAIEVKRLMEKLCIRIF